MLLYWNSPGDNEEDHGKLQVNIRGGTANTLVAYIENTTQNHYHYQSLLVY
jgi:hypothetical protein